MHFTGPFLVRDDVTNSSICTYIHTTIPFPGSFCHIRTDDDVEGLDMWRLTGMTKKTVAVGLI